MRKMTTKFMRHRGVSLILATGGTGLVRAAYSSGTPAIGVGPGNAPAWICDDADLDAAAAAVVTSKTFDNGMTCGAEHNLVVDASVALPFTEALTRHGACILTADEAAEFTSRVIDPANQTLRSELIGQSASHIAARNGIYRPYPIRLLIVRTTARDVAGPYGGEKLAPVLSLFTQPATRKRCPCARACSTTPAPATRPSFTRRTARALRGTQTRCPPAASSSTPLAHRAAAG